MNIVPALVLLVLAAGAASAERIWVNNIAVGEYNLTWGYTEGFTDNDSMIYRINLDRGLGNNDSFINAWELLKIDKEMRGMLRGSIENEFDVRINNESSGIEMIDVDSTLSPAIIGNTNISEPIVNRYNVTYRWKDSLLNASSIWFLGQAKSPVTIIMPSGVDITNTSGMDNVTVNAAVISGFFSGMPGNASPDRGEATINFAKNTSVQIEAPMNLTNVTSEGTENVTEPMIGILSKIRDGTILVAGFVLILLIYVLRVRKK